jgi:hypothetical protein
VARWARRPTLKWDSMRAASVMRKLRSVRSVRCSLCC